VIWERLTCREQLVFVGQLYGLRTVEAGRKADSLLEALDLTEKANAQGRTLSGGMKRRLNLAMALVHDPQIVVLDEPEAGLDPQSRVKVREFIQSLARRKTVILTTHNMDEADRVADRVAIIDHGELLVVDTPQALKQRMGAGDVIEIGLEAGGAEASPAEVAGALQDMVQEARLAAQGRLLTVRALNAVGTLPALLDRVEALGMHPADVRVRANTLEDVFIQLTGRRLRE
jgi:ABC-2 type transport system ATP-binding protein